MRCTVDEQSYVKEGVGFLIVAAEISFVRDTEFDLLPLLRLKGLVEGFSITSRYKCLLVRLQYARCTTLPGYPSTCANGWCWRTS